MITTTPEQSERCRQPATSADCPLLGTADLAAAVRFAVTATSRSPFAAGVTTSPARGLRRRVMIDLSAMRAVSFDPVERTALVQGGALWADVDHETQAHGLATTGGIVRHAGVGGLGLAAASAG